MVPREAPGKARNSRDASVLTRYGIETVNYGPSMKPRGFHAKTQRRNAEGRGNTEQGNGRMLSPNLFPTPLFCLSSASLRLCVKT